MAKKNEFNTQVAVCNWLKTQYPEVIFRSDLGGIRLTVGQARQVKMLQHTRAYPDLTIAEPISPYNGLFIEIKYESSDMYNANGITFKKSEHLFEQACVLRELENKGYCADFRIGFEGCCSFIKWYLEGCVPAITMPPIYARYIDQLSDWYYKRQLEQGNVRLS